MNNTIDAVLATLSAKRIDSPELDLKSELDSLTSSIPQLLDVTLPDLMSEIDDKAKSNKERIRNELSLAMSAACKYWGVPEESLANVLCAAYMPNINHGAAGLVKSIINNEFNLVESSRLLSQHQALPENSSATPFGDIKALKESLGNSVDTRLLMTVVAKYIDRLCIDNDLPCKSSISVVKDMITIEFSSYCRKTFSSSTPAVVNLNLDEASKFDVSIKERSFNFSYTGTNPLTSFSVVFERLRAECYVIFRLIKLYIKEENATRDAVQKSRMASNYRELTSESSAALISDLKTLLDSLQKQNGVNKSKADSVKISLYEVSFGEHHLRKIKVTKKHIPNLCAPNKANFTYLFSFNGRLMSEDDLYERLIGLFIDVSDLDSSGHITTGEWVEYEREDVQ
ncbi:hypothetical protein QTV49_004633 [Vibrio vulnificus]|nr:hypothetical protein [Vibrio vulnificus]